MSEPVRFDFTIQKSDRTGRFVAGWLSVVEKNGQPVEDTQGDVIEIGEVAKAFRAYMKGARVIKARHSGAPVGELVEMVVVDDDFAKAVGMTDTKRGVWGGAEITDEKTREEVKSGVLKSFSIGGRGKRTPIAKMSPSPSDVHADRVIGSTKKPIGGGRVRFTLSERRRRLVRRALAR